MDKFNDFKNKLKDRYFDEEDQVKENIREIKEIKEIKRDDPKIEIKKEIAITRKPSIISDGTVINGSINDGYDLEVQGKIMGDVMIQGRLTVNGGEIVGNVHAESVGLNHSKIKGNIECQSTLNATAKSYIVGMIIAQEVVLDSRCKGNVHIAGKLHLMKEASVEGDIEAKQIIVEEGALIDGNVKMLKGK
ncbi:MAG: bactofilin family protein [Beduini sp.]|uniref:bactofilin family protein n=1 Tax=Beduini sp. TaxID=1922300 RepID=UPI00399FC56E